MRFWTTSETTDSSLRSTTPGYPTAETANRKSAGVSTASSSTTRGSSGGVKKSGLGRPVKSSVGGVSSMRPFLSAMGSDSGEKP